METEQVLLNFPTFEEMKKRMKYQQNINKKVENKASLEIKVFINPYESL